MAKAVDDMVVDHADRLHESVANRGANELESAALEALAQGVRFRSLRRHLLECLAGVLQHAAVDELPDVMVERSELRLYSQERRGVLDGRFNLEPVADDSRIG